MAGLFSPGDGRLLKDLSGEVWHTNFFLSILPPCGVSSSLGCEGAACPLNLLFPRDTRAGCLLCCYQKKSTWHNHLEITLAYRYAHHDMHAPCYPWAKLSFGYTCLIEHHVHVGKCFILLFITLFLPRICPTQFSSNRRNFEGM